MQCCSKFVAFLLTDEVTKQKIGGMLRMKLAWKFLTVHIHIHKTQNSLHYFT